MEKSKTKKVLNLIELILEDSMSRFAIKYLNNDDTTYYIETGDGSTSGLTINKKEYAVSSTVTHIQGEQGVLNRNESSISVVVNKNIIYNEDLFRSSRTSRL